MAMTMSRPVAMQAGLSRAAPSLSLRASPMAPARMAVRMQAAQRNVDSQASRVIHCTTFLHPQHAPLDLSTLCWIR